MAKIILKGFIVVPDNEITMVTDALSEHIEKTRSESGCLIFKIDPDKKIKINLMYMRNS